MFDPITISPICGEKRMESHDDSHVNEPQAPSTRVHKVELRTSVQNHSKVSPLSG